MSSAEGAGGAARPPAGLRELVYRYRGPLLAPPLLAALVAGGDAAGAWAWGVGLGLFAFGTGLRVWAQEHVRYRLDGAHSLATTGPYRRLRNPVYLGTTLLCVGAVATTGRLWLAAVTAAWCVAVYAPVVRFEEDHLEGKFGDDYRRYRSRVPRWRPRLGAGPLELATGGYLLPALRAEAGTLLVLVPFVLRALL